jgi:ABC-type transport system substrate-binding protein
VRRALAEGLDKDALIAQALDGQVVRLDTPILPGWWAASQEAAWYPYEQQRAADALTSLGYVSQSNGVRAKDGTTFGYMQKIKLPDGTTMELVNGADPK